MPQANSLFYVENILGLDRVSWEDLSNSPLISVYELPSNSNCVTTGDIARKPLDISTPEYAYEVETIGT